MRKLILFLIIPVLFSASACKKFLDVNKSPNNPEKVPPSVLLPETTIGIAFANTNDLDRATSVIIQHLAGTGTQSVDYDTYKLEGYFDNQWNLELYNGVINNLVKLIKENQETNPQYAGVAKLEMAYAFSMITDLWGDVPYSQAGFGLDYLNPRFDKQQDIYQGNSADGIKSLFDLVKEGMADLDKTSILKPKTDDIVYGGDMAKWKRMGNTLLLKFANTIAFKNPALAKSTIDAVLTANNYINSNSLDFQVPFGGTGNQNPLYSFNWVNRKTDQILSTRFLDMETKLNDSVRLSKFFTKPGGQFVSYDNGNTVSSPSENARSKYALFLTGAAGEAPAYLVTYAQVNFILAESALMLGTAGNANTYYQAGIRANMSKVGITKDSIDLYFATNPTVVTLAGTQEQQLEQIITQKYISWVGNGIEAFNDFRRTGYPKLALARNAAGHDPNTIPTRLTYPNGELQRNSNCPNPITRTTVKMWWAR
ncbi:MULTISPECIES: SusD/RagB family nutrient-binding outer membrane lipoprotein [Niastella]|uniref:SusD/RagB family nutrient-binding outer membrane lipoprotein n=1 Tax=Niastella soli TaxID=2821487 RepID=A0ABS3YMR5_9BACT|nr:SusD/RagB family nutrient-binding outer membrane lipoprotein [Niastella soli]MBO9199186.1 SusD/RagB family nutrient-binding outer membrane lipoprotein [Niastella soli]